VTKNSRAQLAVNGGRPEFDVPLHVGRPNVLNPDRVLKRVGEALDRRWLTNFGPLVKQFETQVAEAAGTEHCVAMSSATSALEILVRARGLRGEVIVPSFTYIATPHVLQWLGITPVFCDIDEETANLDPAEVEKLITPETTGIIGVHVWGRPCAVDVLPALAADRGLTLLYDGAHAFGCSTDGRPLGGFGDAEVFSFHATKFVNAFEGGTVTTHDDELAAKVRSLHYFGFTPDGDVAEAGINAKMPEACAAMGLTSLEDLPEILAANRAHHLLYAQLLADLPGIRLRRPGPGELSNHQFAVLEVDAAAAGLDRDALAALLTAENVLVRKHFHPGCHQLGPYRDNPGRHVRRPLTRTEALSGRVLQLPTGTEITADHVERLCRLIALAVG
jgi:dTDP-4-amino-4,6-dideoxygalactose transaminase